MLSVFHPQLKEAIGTASTTLPLPFDPVVEEVQGIEHAVYRLVRPSRSDPAKWRRKEEEMEVDLK